MGLRPMPTLSAELDVERSVQIFSDDVEITCAPDPSLHAEAPAALEQAKFVEIEPATVCA